MVPFKSRTMEKENWERSWEPMDVDLSHNSAMDISTRASERDIIIIDDDDDDYCTSPISAVKNDQYTTKIKSEELVTDIKREPDFSFRAEHIETPVIKKYHINNVRRPPPKKYTVEVLVTVVVIVCISWIVYQIKNIRCLEEMNLESIRQNLPEKIHGQEDAIQTLVKALDSKVASKILFFYGGTGVGKTYALSLILQNSWNSSNVYHYTMPSFIERITSELMLGMTLCQSSILVVDDLTTKDLNISLYIQDIVLKNKNLGKNITIILVFNCDNMTGFDKKCDETFSNELRMSFDNVPSYKQYINFKPLTEQHLRKCIENELKYNQNVDIENLMKNFNVTLDGCKGVYTKMKIMNYL